MNVDTPSPMSNEAMRSVIEKELATLQQQGLAKWKVRRFRAISNELLGVAAAQRAEKTAVTEEALVKALHEFMQRLAAQQSKSYRAQVETQLNDLQRVVAAKKRRRICCSKLPLIIWPLCDASC
jgi:hypothetical protein